MCVGGFCKYHVIAAVPVLMSMFAPAASVRNGVGFTGLASPVNVAQFLTSKLTAVEEMVGGVVTFGPFGSYILCVTEALT